MKRFLQSAFAAAFALTTLAATAQVTPTTTPTGSGTGSSTGTYNNNTNGATTIPSPQNPTRLNGDGVYPATQPVPQTGTLNSGGTYQNGTQNSATPVTPQTGTGTMQNGTMQNGTMQNGTTVPSGTLQQQPRNAPERRTDRPTGGGSARMMGDTKTNAETRNNPAIETNGQAVRATKPDKAARQSKKMNKKMDKASKKTGDD